MFEEEEYDEGGEEEEEGEEELEAEEETEDDAGMKNEVILKDISLMQDIFHYIDRTRNRISQQLIFDARLKEWERWEAHRLQDAAANHEDTDESSLHWSEYENLDDGQRAQLLEKAIMVLGNDERTATKTRMR